MSTKKWKTLITVLIAGILYQFIWKLYQKKKKLPPGPSNLVMFYYLLRTAIVRRFYDPIYVTPLLLKAYDQNGLIYHSFPVVHIRIAIISSSKMAKKILNHRSALDRPIIGDSKSKLHIENTADGTAPFAGLNGKAWEHRRKLSQSILFRMCTQSKFLDKILRECLTSVVFVELDNNYCGGNGQLWYPSALMKYVAFNTIFYSNYGRHCAMNDKLYTGMVRVITETFQLFESGIVFGCLPQILLFFVKLNPFSDYYKILSLIKTRDALSKQITNRTNEIKKQTMDRNGNKEAMYYVDYIEKELTESEVEADMGALFGAGTDTTSSALNFAIVLSAKYSEIQEQIRDELIACYDRNVSDLDSDSEYRLFEMRWINELVYFRAYVYEVLRVSSITKGGLPHCASEDILIEVNESGTEQYCIPKGTIIAYSIEWMHKNNTNENWVNSSNEMCLENWINSETNKFEMNASFLTFGFGRRDCVGRTLAVKELYIIMADLLLNYRFSFPNKQDRNKEIKTLFHGVNIIDPPIGVVVEKLKVV